MRTFFRKKSLGQCFLSNPSYLDSEAEAIAPNHKTLLEIGPGDGRLTERLVSSGAKKLFLIEKDTQYIPILKNKFSGHNVEVIQGDFLELSPFKVDLICGNLPYYISSAITFRLLEWKFKRAVLMYQKEFCEKMFTIGKDKSRLSFFSQYYFDMEPLFIVPRSAFRPAPKVDSMLIELIPKNPGPLDKNTSELISMFFQHRPKTIHASIRMICKRKGVTESAEVLSSLQKNFDTSKRIFEFNNREILELGTQFAKLLL